MGLRKPAYVGDLARRTETAHAVLEGAELTLEHGPITEVAPLPVQAPNSRLNFGQIVVLTIGGDT